MSEKDDIDSKSQVKATKEKTEAKLTTKTQSKSMTKPVAKQISKQTSESLDNEIKEDSEIKDNLNNIKILSEKEIKEKVSKQLAQSKISNKVPIQNPNIPPKQEINIGRRAEIKLYEADYEHVDNYYNKEPEWKPVNMGKDSGKPIIVTFKTPQDIKNLQMQYAQCDQRFEIVRWIDPVPEQVQPKQYQQTCNNNSSQNAIQTTQLDESTVSKKISKPKFYNIGGIEIKEDDGKIYQKQWIKLSKIESQNYRIINDKNNAIVNLNGKSIEMRKWVLVENTDENMEN